MERDGSEGTNYTLPLLVATPTDVRRVCRELDALNAYLDAQKVREPGLPVQRLPKVSRMLDDLAVTNKLNLLHATVRGDLEAFLQRIDSSASVVHISFAAEPSAAAVHKVLQWLRQNIRADILVQVGLEPSIVAGCVVRTTNRSFDFSLGRYMHEQRHILLEALTVPVVSARTAGASNG